MKFTLKTILLLILTALIFGGCSLHKTNKSYKQTHIGKISGYAYDEFKLNLNANDILTTNINTTKLDVIIYSPINISLKNQNPISIEKQGQYVLRVLMPRAFARRKEEYKYTLSISIKPSK